MGEKATQRQAQDAETDADGNESRAEADISTDRQESAPTPAIERTRGPIRAVSAHSGVGDRASVERDGGYNRQSNTSRRSGYVPYDTSPDPASLSDRYGMTVQPSETRRLQRLAAEHGSDRVQRWADEGMTVDTMGKPRDMEAFRERQADRSAEIPADIERRNQASTERNAARNREDGPAGETGAPDAVRRVVSSSGRSMDESVQREMESKMGDDFSDVQVHTGPKAAAAADSINARAFTVGNHVAFNRGEYRPGSDDGKRVLAHELTHVRQQTDGRVSMLPKADAEQSGPRAVGMHVQPKLEVSSPDDPAEKEAERVAEQVVQSLTGTGGDAHDEGVATARQSDGRPTELVSPAGGGNSVPRHTESKVKTAVQGGGKSLPSSVRASFESKMGADFSDVQVHAGDKANEAARSINARAYTMGSDIAFAAGQYKPNSKSGQQLLAHELTHTMQQTGASRKPAHRTADSDVFRFLGFGGGEEEKESEEKKTDKSLSGGTGMQAALNGVLNEKSKGRQYTGPKEVWHQPELNKRYYLTLDTDATIRKSLEKTKDDIIDKIDALYRGYQHHPSVNPESAGVMFAGDVVESLAGTHPPDVEGARNSIYNNLQTAADAANMSPRKYGAITAAQDAVTEYNEIANEWNTFTEDVIGTADATITTLEEVRDKSAIIAGAGLTVATGGYAGPLYWASINTAQKVGEQGMKLNVDTSSSWSVKLTRATSEIVKTALKEYALAIAGKWLNDKILGFLMPVPKGKLASQFGQETAEALGQASKEALAKLIANISVTSLKKCAGLVFERLWDSWIGQYMGAKVPQKAFTEELAKRMSDDNFFLTLLANQVS